MQRRSFDAMGTWVECFVESPATPELTRALEAVEGEFARLEAMLSRFRPESELSRLNRERSIEASEELRELTALALEAREETGGRFDPTLHDAVVAAGYDRTFSELTDDGAETPPAAGGGEVTVTGNRIELGPDASLDLGGIAKGYAADRCVSTLAEHGPALVNAGGDIAISGPRPLGRRWPVAVDVPSGLLTVELDGGGLATSGRDRRHWRRNGQDRHHLIDPRTLRPAEGGPLSVTVAAATATAAEVLAKALFLADDAEREAKLAGLAAVIVPNDGRPCLVGIVP